VSRGRPRLRTRDEIAAALRASNGNVALVAKSLGYRSQDAVRNVAKQLGLSPIRLGRPVSVDLTPRETEAVDLMAEIGNQHKVASLMQVSHQRVSQLLARARARVGVHAGKETESGE
jgi:predicted DNA-binding protein (UPF0251 family)